jgi:hypothetical protein
MRSRDLSWGISIRWFLFLVIFTICGAYVEEYSKRVEKPDDWSLHWLHLLVWDAVPKWLCMGECSPESPIMQWHQRMTQPIYEKVIASMAPNNLRRLNFLMHFRLHYYFDSTNLSECFVLRPYFQEGWKNLQFFTTEPVHMTGSQLSSFYGFLRLDYRCLRVLHNKIVSREEFQHNIGERIRIAQNVIDRFPHIETLEPRLLENMLYVYTIFFNALRDRAQYFSTIGEGAEKNKLCALARPYQDRLRAMLKRRAQIVHPVDFNGHFDQGGPFATEAFDDLKAFCPTNPLSTNTTNEVSL